MKMHQAMMIAAAGWLCVAAAAQADPVTWIGTGSGQWTNAANWDVRVPLAGDDVTLAVNGAEIVLAETTPQLGSITLSGGATLVFTNWTTALQSDAVTIGNLGTVTCAGPFTDAGPTNRVWIQATEVEIAAGGKIDVTARGFAAQNGPGKGDYSYWGPSGGSHGGMGGNQLAIIRSATLFYDAVQTPSLPGSGGGNSGASESVVGGAGGGAVYIDADTVTVNGEILAEGESGASSTKSGGGGGSIWIGCETFQGSGGSLSVRGGGTARLSTLAGTGGGGRLAIHYDPVAQALLPRPTVALDARAGAQHTDLSGVPGDPGTLYLTDYSFLPTSGTFPDIQGRLSTASAPQWGATSLTVSGTEIWFAQTGIQISVDHDLTLTDGARLAVGGAHFTNWWVTANAGSGGNGWERRLRNYAFDSSSTPPELAVGGDLRIEGASRFELFSTDAGATATGAVLRVVQDVALVSGGIYLNSHPRTGASPRLSMRNLTVAANAFISAEGRGCSGSRYRRRGYGTGGGLGKYLVGNGASYGGVGGTKTGEAAAATYGDANAPEHCGSGGGAEAYFSGDGGGLIHIVAEQQVLLDGVLNADGAQGWGIDDDEGNSGAGSGGGIHIRCNRLAGTGGMLQANGADHGNIAGWATGGGGGGRIAVWCVTDRSIGLQATALGGASASSGATIYSDTTDGTVVWGSLPQPATVIAIR